MGVDREGCKRKLLRLLDPFGFPNKISRLWKQAADREKPGQRPVQSPEAAFCGAVVGVS
jgi:hypothetical protein